MGAVMKFLKSAVFMAAMLVSAGLMGADSPTANLQLTMLTKVNVQGLALWDITNDATNDNGDVDGSKLTAANWAKLLEIGKALEEGGRTLATSNGIVVASPGAKLQDEGNAGASKAVDVQRFVDAKPALFRNHALKLQQTGADIIAAATKHDVKRLSALSNSLDEVCENCHVNFWYPNQK
jgi:hypothetical protein